MNKFKGLTDDQVKKSLETYGSNVIPEPEPETFWDKFKENFEDPMIKLLCVIAVIMFGMFCLGQAAIYEPLGTVIAILLVSFINAKSGVSNDNAYRKLKKG